MTTIKDQIDITERLIDAAGTPDADPGTRIMYLVEVVRRQADIIAAMNDAMRQAFPASQDAAPIGAPVFETAEGGE